MSISLTPRPDGPSLSAVTRKVCIFRKSTIADNLAVMRIQGFMV